MGEAHAEWHLSTLHVLYEVLGWIAFVAWSCSFYPQVILNFIRKSVIGLNFDYLLLNLSKHTFYLLYNACLYLIPVVQCQYHEKYGFSELIPVGPSDVAYSVHAVLFTTVTAYQILIYEKGTQKVSMITVAISGAIWFAAALCVIVAWPQGQWFWLVSDFNNIQVAITLIKYIPQVWMNYRRKSTVGFSIENVLLDLCGGFSNIVQMGVQSIDQGSMDNFLGDNGKFSFSLVVMVFDSIFVVQHYILYHRREFPAELYTALGSTHGKETNGEEADNAGMFSGRRFVRITGRFTDLSERFPDKFCLS